MHRFIKVEFDHFKAFKRFRVDLRRFNILVGPNNAGKSTVLIAFRILFSAMRKASARKPTVFRGPKGIASGYDIDLSTISVAEENIVFNYLDQPASVVFHLSNGNSLQLYFPENGKCYLIPDAQGKSISSPAAFKSNFNCPISFVPILGPVDPDEQLYEKEAARLALLNYRASRNFRNIWYHNPDEFEDFRSTLKQTWPGMDITRPEMTRSLGKPRLHMFCPEDRIPREIFWAGFGFQVWCQMLTHIIKSKKSSLFLIDEPDIYLHSELQRQLLGFLRNLGPDIIIATHSTEIVTEAESDEIVLINKTKPQSRRIKNSKQISEVFGYLGSNINPILTQVAKTRRVLFVEGKDFQILGKFARKLGETGVSTRREFAVVPVEGFNPDRVKALKTGMEETLGSEVIAAVILDRDYRCKSEIASIKGSLLKFCRVVSIHDRKEIENFLLVPAALERAAENRLKDENSRERSNQKIDFSISGFLLRHCDERHNYVVSRCLAEHRRYIKKINAAQNDTVTDEQGLTEIQELSKNLDQKLALSPGKEVFSALNSFLQEKTRINLTASSVIEAMTPEEIPHEMRRLITEIRDFGAMSVEV